MTKKRPPDLETFEADGPDLLGTSRAGCPPVQMLRAARADALPEELQLALAAHLGECVSCRTLQEDLDSLPESPAATPQEVRRILSRVQRTRGEEQTGGASRWAVSWRAAAVTAGLALCAVLVVWQLRERPAPLVSTAPPAVPAAPPQAASTPDVLKLDKPAVKMTLAVLTWRGRESEQPRFLEDIAPALDLYRADQFAEAAARLEALSAKYEDSVEVFFYLGVSRLFVGEAAEASQALERAARLADDSFAADVSWYLALSYQRSGRMQEARARLKMLCEAPGTYRERACAALGELGSSTAAPGPGQTSPKR